MRSATSGRTTVEAGAAAFSPTAEDVALAYDHAVPDPVVSEVIAFEPLPVGARGSRRAIVRWSDGTTGEALRWWGDEVLFSEGDLIGKSQAQLRRLHFGRDRDYLRSTGG